MNPQEPSQEDALAGESLPEPALAVVGLGASAGGIQALRHFFAQMVPDSGLAFVVIVHLSPEHESGLAMLLQQSTAMPVAQVTEPVKIQPNHVYVISPIRHLSLVDHRLDLSEPDQPSGRRVAIDLFFRTMAETLGPAATAVVLSGTGSDGAMGLTRVKEMGGLTIAQDPDDAEYDGMPRSAIATGLVDYILPVANIPAQIMAYRDTGQALRLPADPARRDIDNDALRELFVLLRIRTGHDFANYKRSTMLRRIGRRLQVNSLTDLPGYLTLLREHPAEVQALLRDLLISVTNFFRDQEAFAALEQILPGLFAGKQPDDQVRVWVAACATGEEAYSVAILLREYATRLDQPPAIQIFATDIDEEAISVAREGLYPENIVADVSPERLRRFFNEERGSYRIKKEIRDMVLFAPHNLLRDPPFSRLDLITCRNLLIYLDREVQERLLELFHFVLRPDGRLMLGSSESADGLPGLFTVVDKKNRIYGRRTVARSIPMLPAMPLMGRIERRRPDRPAQAPVPHTLSFDELHQNLLELYAPPSLVVNEAYDIVHLSERVGRFLKFTGGEPSYNLLKVIHPDLRLELRTALFRAGQKGQPSESRRVLFNLDEQASLVDILVRPVVSPEAARGFMLVIFDELGEAGEQAPPLSSDEDTEPMVRQLDDELQRMREQLRMTIEQYETSTEELRASNEELQAMNEELRSATEELETSKEELQSVNEELTTVNQELKSKVDEVSRVNSDLQNLMASTDIGTVFLDRELRVKRYTPRIQELFNLIASDINRPLAHVTHLLTYNHLLEDAARVLDRLMLVDREVQHLDGRWFLARLLPYRTLEDRIDGVVLTFVDITERKRAEEALRANEQQLSVILEHMPVGVLITDPFGRLIFANPRIAQIFGEAYPFPKSIADNVGWKAHMANLQPYGPQQLPLARVLQSGEAIIGEEMHFPHPSGSWLVVNTNATAVRNSQGEIISAVLTFEDITERKRAEEALRHAHDELEERVEERTAMLEQMNKTLQSEIVERRRIEAERRNVLRQLLQVQEEERQRLSREIHDQLGQQITALLLELNALKETSRAQTEVFQRINQIQEQVNALGQELHQIARGLRPTLLDDIGLVAALSSYVEEWSRHSGITVVMHTTGFDDGGLQPDIKTTIYRVVLEALLNVIKHSRANSVNLLLEQHDGAVVAIVEDNGQGFDAEALLEQPEMTGRLGLLGMQERVALVGGTLTIESTPGSGTTVFVRVPLLSG